MDKTLKELCQYPAPTETYTRKEKSWEEKETGAVRTRTRFAWLPIYMGMGDLIPLRGCKIQWLRKVHVVEKQVMYRWSEFDDGWSYQNYWKSWKEKWVVIDVIRVK
jgi:hypothetical protein